VRHIFAPLLVLTAGTLVAQVPSIHPGAPAYVEPMAGYELDLTAALVKKKVPLTIVRDRSQAAFIIRGTLNAHSPAPPAVMLGKDGLPSTGFPLTRSYLTRETEANITVFDAQSSQVVFAYSVNKSADTNQRKSTAEASAKHLKEFILNNRR
jgi:hypothetical protein